VLSPLGAIALETPGPTAYIHLMPDDLRLAPTACPVTLDQLLKLPGLDLEAVFAAAV
jgi:hypothetical protein